ncbi:MAG: hypothetical protein EP318_00790 [Rhodobacteraceae bacterium]|nr:MAG: hypothetical protein EP318_00790 [Paracoccaceae bacterium]
MFGKKDVWAQGGAVLLLFLLAFALRALGADYGYFHGDERINEAAKVLTGDLVPGQHFYPPLIHYLNALGLAGLFATGLALDWWPGAGAFRAQYFSDPTLFYVTARLIAAGIGALMAPLFFLIARRCGLAGWRAWALGLLGALFPLGVFMAHIAKGDAALATATVAVFWAFLARLDAGRSGRWDIWLGVFAVLVVSFKHSGVFVLVPFALGAMALIARAEGLRAMGQTLGRALLVVLVLWPLLNIGILLDFGNFLAFQKIQAVMSLRMEGGVWPGIVTLAERSLRLVLGLNPVMAAVALVTPVLLALPGCALCRKPALFVIWGALVLATGMVAVMVGPRQPEHLWIANFAGFLLLAGLCLAALGERVSGLGRLALAVLAGGVLLTAAGTGIAVTEALAPPLWVTTDAYIAANLADRRIMTMADSHLPRRKEAQEMEIARWQRLAEKYATPLPEMAEERLIRENAPEAVFYIGMPTVLYGLEGVDEDDPDYEVRAHVWPPQREEWQLDYWREQGFDIFVVKDPEFLMAEVESDLMRAFFRDMDRRCAVETRFEAGKPLFLERPIAIYRCP